MFGVEKTALEGAGPRPLFPKSRPFDLAEKTAPGRNALEDDRISGPVYAAIMSSGADHACRDQDETLYEKNREIFLAHLRRPRKSKRDFKLQHIASGFSKVSVESGSFSLGTARGSSGNL